MARKLNAVIANEATIKDSATRKLKDLLDRSLRHPDSFSGMVREYRPLDDEDERFPPESKRVQSRFREIIEESRKAWSDWIDVTYTKDVANTHAKADVTVDGEVLLSDAPVPFLLFLEKRVTDMRTMFAMLPTLDEAHDWHWEQSRELYATEPIETHRTRKVERPIVLYDATDKHPAQTQLITKDEIAGHWLTTHLSGAVTRGEKARLVARAEKLLAALKDAREAANAVEAPAQSAEKVLEYLFSAG